MIQLKEQKPFGRGSHREVYRHPQREDRCLKLMVEDWRVCHRRKRAPLVSRLFRSQRYFHESLAELHFSEKLGRRVDDLAWGYVTKSYGMVETDNGEALEVDLVRDFDGEISLSLKAYLLEFGLTPECEAAISHFWEGVGNYKIFLQGRPDNVAVKKGEDGSLTLIAIDGFGLPQLIPLAKWFGFARRRFLKKRKRRQAYHIGKILELKKSGEAVEGKGIILSDYCEMT